MKYRKLRIAFSTVCGIFCLLLIALWVRSYSTADLHIGVGPNGPAKQFVLKSHDGYLVVAVALGLIFALSR